MQRKEWRETRRDEDLACAVCNEQRPVAFLICVEKCDDAA
jgi:hypothetical protein